MKFFLLLMCLLISTAAFSQQPPNCNDSEYRQFDFWAGNWVVTDKDGNVMGYNRVEPILNDCALQENWTGEQGTDGKSFNFYDRQTKQWHQTWIDNSGGALYLDGNLQGQTMVLQGTRLGRNGKPVLHQISYTPMEDGRVKQYWQASGDDGKTWRDVFLGFYKRRGELTSM